MLSKIKVLTKCRLGQRRMKKKTVEERGEDSDFTD